MERRLAIEKKDDIQIPVSEVKSKYMPVGLNVSSIGLEDLVQLAEVKASINKAKVSVNVDKQEPDSSQN